MKTKAKIIRTVLNEERLESEFHDEEEGLLAFKIGPCEVV
jgi:hypothetical protein